MIHFVHPHRRPIPEAHVRVHLLRGERRIVRQRIVNDSEDAIVFEPSVAGVFDTTTESPVPGALVTTSPSGPIALAPGASVELSFAIDAAALSTGHAYRVELRFADTFVPPLVVALLVERPEPIVARHDPSRVRAWLRGHCFGHDALRWIAPPTRSLHAPHGSGHGA